MFHPSWYEALKVFLESPAMREIGLNLKHQADRGIRIAPRFPDTFRAFKESRFNNLHAVILGQDPYPGIIDSKVTVADGIAFSSKYSKSPPKSLMKIYEAIDRDIYNGEGYHLTDTSDLTHWAHQGVLMLNCSLTLPLAMGKSNHMYLWEPFISHVINTIVSEKDGISWILMGRDAKGYQAYLTNPSHQILSCEHPSACNHRPDKQWRDENVFRNLQAFQKHIYNIQISW